MSWHNIDVSECCCSDSSSGGCTINVYYAEKGTLGAYGYYGMYFYTFSTLSPGYRFSWHDISDLGGEGANAGEYEIKYLIGTEDFNTDQTCDERREELESLGYWI